MACWSDGVMERRKMGPKGLFRLLYIVIVLSILPCSSHAGDKVTGKLSVYVVNYPLKYFAERVGGEHVRVVFPGPANEDPAYWVPDIKVIADYQKADLILRNGAGYARWVHRVSLPLSKIVNTSAKFKDQYIRTKGAVTHSHGSGGEHAHEDVAFTTWMDFNLAAGQARAIAVAYGRKRSTLKNTFEKKLVELEKDLFALDRNIKVMVSNNQSQPLIASHPVYDYFARRYGLNLKNVHWEPDQVLTDQLWMELQKILKTHTAKWMIWEGDPIQESIAKLKSVGINSLVFNPCANVPQKGDFLSVMQKNIKNLAVAFE